MCNFDGYLPIEVYPIAFDRNNNDVEYIVGYVHHHLTASKNFRSLFIESYAVCANIILPALIIIMRPTNNSSCCIPFHANVCI